MRLTSFGLSDIGPSRPNNEDVLANFPELGFFALADGMGGHQAGEVAAKEAIASLILSIRKIKSTSCMELIIDLKDAIEQANQWVYCMGKSSTVFSGMGTTLCCLLWTEDLVIYAHVGDSRIYRFRNGKLQQLTKDHSLLTKLFRQDHSLHKHTISYPYKHVITRAIGISKRANPEISYAPHQPEDIYFLCTDGLSDVLTLLEIETVLNYTKNLPEACYNLISQAKIKGGSDNMTLLMVQSEAVNEANLFRS